MSHGKTQIQTVTLYLSLTIYLPPNENFEYSYLLIDHN